ncbi:MAG TPA: hypothetical protein VH478_00120 [Trebonia sp.]|nr:hypothetical protein [Trebonia sp.]
MTADHAADDPALQSDPALQEAMRELEAAIYDARVAWDCLGLGEVDRAHASALTARVAIDAAVTAIEARLPAGASAPGDGPGPMASQPGMFQPGD